MTTATRPRPGLGRSGGRGDGADTVTAHPSGGWSVQSVGEWLRSPVAPYYLVLVSASVLTAFGLYMVLSASSVGSYLDTGSSYTVFLSQLIYATGGIVLAIIGSRLPVSVWKKLAWPGIFLAAGLQMLVFTPLGAGEFQGNQNWIEIGGRSLQPSEFGKIALVVFGALVLATKRRVIHKPLHAVVPLVFPFGLLLVGLVLQGNDLGTGMIMLAIIVGLLWAAGLPARWFVGLGAVAVAGVAFLAAGSANRMSRIQTWIGDICDNAHSANGACFQKIHAEYALADGGWWGLGPGGSREKWELLPEPHNDFILAIIGEEFGLPGTFAVLALFAVLAYACYRIISQAEDMFTRLAAAGLMVWLLGQALVNIGSVIGMFPIIGVPLPLVSSGGSALVSALIGVGLLLALARNVPGAQDRLGGRTSTLRRTLTAMPAGRAPALTGQGGSARSTKASARSTKGTSAATKRASAKRASAGKSSPTKRVSSTSRTSGSGGRTSAKRPSNAAARPARRTPRRPSRGGR